LEATYRERLGTQLKHVLRRLMRSPMFTVVTLVTIAVAVGA
jgi:cell division protein FtsX